MKQRTNRYSCRTVFTETYVKLTTLIDLFYNLARLFVIYKLTIFEAGAHIVMSVAACYSRMLRPLQEFHISHFGSCTIYIIHHQQSMERTIDESIKKHSFSAHIFGNTFSVKQCVLIVSIYFVNYKTLRILHFACLLCYRKTGKPLEYTVYVPCMCSLIILSQNICKGRHFLQMPKQVSEDCDVSSLCYKSMVTKH